MTGGFGVAFETGEPVAAASEFDSDDVETGGIVGAAGFRVDPDAVNVMSVDVFDHRLTSIADRVPVGPGNKHALERQPQPQSDGRDRRVEVRIHCHVDIGGKYSDQQQYQSPRRHLTRFWYKQSHAEHDLSDPLRITNWLGHGRYGGMMSS